MTGDVARARAVPAAGGGRGRPGSMLLLQNRIIGVAAFLALLVLFFGLLTQRFATIGNVNTIALNASILVVVACAEAIVVLTRNYDLSVGSIVALASYVGLDIVRRFPEAGPMLVVAPGPDRRPLRRRERPARRLWQAALGDRHAGHALDLPGPRLPLCRRRPDQRPGSAGLGRRHRLEPHPRHLDADARRPRRRGLSALLLRQTSFGRQIYAIGSNPAAAQFYGLNARRIVFGAYVLCGALTGLAAYLFAARATYIVPYLAQGLELTALAAVVVGGVSVLGGSGSVIGAAVGAAALATLDNGLVLLGARSSRGSSSRGLRSSSRSWSTR